MTQAPVYWSLAVVDIEGFGRRTDTAQQALRADLRAAVAAALAAQGIHDSATRAEDTGDGIILRIAPSVPKAAVTRALTGHLNTELVRRTMAPHPVEEMRLRLALHAGEVAEDDFGIVGTDLNTTCRLVDATALREVLTAAARAYLVVAVSRTWYEAVIRHGHEHIDPSAYLPARLDVKELHDTIWINVPSLRTPPGLPPYEPEGAPSTRGEPTGAGAGAGAVTLTANVSGGGNAYLAARDQTINHGPARESGTPDR